jgi:transcriptional regulator of acetoin/glycerol metabolism
MQYLIQRPSDDEFVASGESESDALSGARQNVAFDDGYRGVANWLAIASAERWRAIAIRSMFRVKVTAIHGDGVVEARECNRNRERLTGLFVPSDYGALPRRAIGREYFVYNQGGFVEFPDMPHVRALVRSRGVALR